MRGEHIVIAVDISEHTEPMCFSCCPLCDNELQEFEEVALAVSHGSLAAVHAWCLSDLLKEQR